MTPTFVLIPGADGRAWYWHRVVPELAARGYEAVAVDLPAGDNVGLGEYTDAVVDAIGDRTGLVVVAQSLAGFTAPLVCTRVPVDLLVLVNAMVPAPGESAGDWWGDTGQDEAWRENAVRTGRGPDPTFELRTDFFHDVPPDVTEAAFAGPPPGGPSDTLFAQPWPLEKWPDVPTRFLQGRDDRFFPVEFQRRVVQDRLGIPVDEMPGGHLVALSQPEELADRLVAYCA
jgi:pimeloyl-ACP methyl ester carboxylesterase